MEQTGSTEPTSESEGKWQAQHTRHPRQPFHDEESPAFVDIYGEETIFNQSKIVVRIMHVICVNRKGFMPSWNTPRLYANGDVTFGTDDATYAKVLKECQRIFKRELRFLQAQPAS